MATGSEETDKELDDAVKQAVIEMPEQDLKTGRSEELLQMASALMQQDPVKGACLTGLVIGRGKPPERKLALAMASYLRFCKEMSPEKVGHVEEKEFLANPPPRLFKMMTGIIIGMHNKGYV